MDTALDCIDTLNSFTSSKELAEFLKMEGVKGYTQDEASCPIANWLVNKLDRPVSVVGEFITIYPVHINWDSDEIQQQEFVTSAVVQEFIGDFDSGEYPDLDRSYDDEEAWW